MAPETSPAGVDTIRLSAFNEAGARWPRKP